MAQPAPRRAAVAAWCLFDFANSSYTTLIITVAFSVYFREAVVGAADNRADQLWGIANFIAMLAVALTSPIVGAIADRSGRKKAFLILATLQTVVATALLWFVTPGRIVLAVALYAVATIGFEIGYVFYNAFLPDVSTPRTIGRVSGWAWAVGYIGGFASLGVCWPWISTDLLDTAGRVVPAAVDDRRFSFLIVSLFYLVFALPAFFLLRESAPQGERIAWHRYPAVGLRRVSETLSHLRRYRETGKFILASLFYNDGITTIIAFSAIYATTTFGFASGELVFLFVVLNVVAFPGALFAGYLADAFGARRTLVVTLVLWIGVVILGALAQTKCAFWMMAAGAAIGMGSTQAVGRSYMAQITPPARQAEFFGFYVLSGKFASMFGPLVFGIISAASGSQRVAVACLLPFFIVGLAFLVRIDDATALRVARDG